MKIEKKIMEFSWRPCADDGKFSTRQKAQQKASWYFAYISAIDHMHGKIGKYFYKR